MASELVDKARRAIVRQYRLYSLRQEIDLETGGLQRADYTIGWSEAVKAPHDVHLVREGERIRILLSPWFDHWSAFWLIKDKISVYLYWLSKAGPEVHHITGSASDGDRFSQGRFSFSSARPQVIPVPDSHFFLQHGYWQLDRAAALEGLPWSDRSAQIVWRGAPSGNGFATARPDLLDSPAVVQRLRLAAIAKRHGIDFGFVSRADSDPNYQNLHQAGWAADSIPGNTWARHKFAIDVDGFTNAWSNLLGRLKLGCCVLKVDSQFGYRQWYYHHLRPFEHYIPVSADFSDLAERLDWLRNNDRKAQQIAEAGQELARLMTFDRETDVAADLIRDHWAQ